MSSKLVALATALALINAPSEAGKTHSSGLWRQMAEVDSAAALQLITENHPGARPELGDASFQQRLAAAAHHVEQRLPEVRNFDGYSALMAGLAADFADGHIWSRSRVQKQTLQWTGVLLKREGQVWRVGSVLPEARLPDIQNARLVECDRVDAEHWADARIRLFVAGEPNEAQRVEAAGRLLTDDGNPFLKRPEQCTFETIGGARESITFRWGQGPTSFVNERIEALQRRAADGYSLTPWRNGYWIRLSGLDDDAEAVVATVQQAETQLRNSTNVILDLRGNGGGDSRYGDAIATTLFGADRVREVATQGSACVGAFWRASAQNIAALKSFRDARTRTDAKTSAALGEVVEGMEKSLANGEPFWPNLPVCAVDQALPIVAAHSPSDAKVVIITDHLCFSSCLVTVDLFRKLGALHVGEATDVSSRYMEARTILLPSGLRDFSTLQKIAVGLPDFGPYSPDIPYPGEMADDEALKTWLQVQLASR